MLPQSTQTLDYALIQYIDYQATLTTLTKFSNSETLESLFNITTSNIRINTYNDDSYNTDNYNLNMNKKSINIVMKITDISKKTPVININEFEELED